MMIMTIMVMVIKKESQDIKNKETSTKMEEVQLKARLSESCCTTRKKVHQKQTQLTQTQGQHKLTHSTH